MRGEGGEELRGKERGGEERGGEVRGERGEGLECCVFLASEIFSLCHLPTEV